MAASRCALGGRFRRCLQTPHETCQYCTRSFCREHTYVLEAYEAVCVRPPCVAKYDDMPRHHGYVRGVRRLNQAGLCGFEGCGRSCSFECAKCLGRFCLGHLSDRLYPASHEPASMACVCPHCWERRRIWSKA